jgi:hypothetical protein
LAGTDVSVLATLDAFLRKGESDGRKEIELEGI